MAILKGINVDEFENVTVLVFQGISMRSKKVGDSIHIAVSESDKSASEDALVINDELSFAKSDKVDNIDMIIDIPNEESMDRFISILQAYKEEYYTK